jgi:hypothetical protein
MRQVLRLLGNRYGAAVSILVVIAVVIGFGKLAGAGRHNSIDTTLPPPATAGTAPTPSTSPEPDDGLVDGGDTSAAPSTSPGGANAQTVAVAFATAWLNHHNTTATQWHKGIATYATKSLSDRLEGVDPGSVPAERMTGNAAVEDQESSYVDIAIPCDTGTLVLTLVTSAGRWLVDGVDWRAG